MNKKTQHKRSPKHPLTHTCYLCGTPAQPSSLRRIGDKEFCTWTCQSRYIMRQLLKENRDIVLFYDYDYQEYIADVGRKAVRKEDVSRDLLSENEWNKIVSHLKLCGLCDPEVPRCRKCSKGGSRVIW